MNQLAIHVEGLGKRYRLGQREPYKALRDSIANTCSFPVRAIMNNFKKRPLASELEQGPSHIWALKNVSFDVQTGEVVGIIGPNGAGKTTLLKIISRVTSPTEGRGEIYGRVGSLLEVGTGFHPELTGRENVYLNGAILGMHKSEIDSKFDEIVAFAEIEQFMGTPMKRYSSGMQVRLAFAIAAHLEPEILLTDEVLAVGDANFQRKCLGKMQSVASEGRTVIFVSHNMMAIERLCSRAIVLDEGMILNDGSVQESIDAYLGMGAGQRAERTWGNLSEAPGNDVVRLIGFRCKDEAGNPCSQFNVTEPIEVEIDYRVLKDGHQLCVSLEFVDSRGQAVMVTMDDYVQGPWGYQEAKEVGQYRSNCLLPGDLFNDGEMNINLRVFSPPGRPNENPHIREPELLRFGIVDEMNKDGVRGSYPEPSWGGIVRPRLVWRTETVDSFSNTLRYD